MCIFSAYVKHDGVGASFFAQKMPASPVFSTAIASETEFVEEVLCMSFFCEKPALAAYSTLRHD